MIFSRILEYLNLVKLGYKDKVLGSGWFFSISSTASENDAACFKSGQRWLENNHLAWYKFETHSSDKIVVNFAPRV